MRNKLTIFLGLILMVTGTVMAPPIWTAPGRSISKKKATIAVKIGPMSARQRSIVKKSLQQWDDISVIEFRITEGRADLNINIVDKISLESAVGVFRGVYRKRGQIEILRGATEQSFYTTTTHEIGHFLGLRHVENEYSIMYYAVRPGNSSEYGNVLRSLDVAILKHFEKTGERIVFSSLTVPIDAISKDMIPSLRRFCRNNRIHVSFVEGRRSVVFKSHTRKLKNISDYIFRGVKLPR